MKAREITLSNVWAYLTGNIRFWLSRHRATRWMVGEMTILQIIFRLFMMDDECYDNGQCKECGCKTINLQFASKRCKGDCYPELMRGRKFIKFLNGKVTKVGKNVWKLDVKNEGENSKRFTLHMNGAVVNDRVVSEEKFEKVQNILFNKCHGMCKGSECSCSNKEARG